MDIRLPLSPSQINKIRPKKMIHQHESLYELSRIESQWLINKLCFMASRLQEYDLSLLMRSACIDYISPPTDFYHPIRHCDKMSATVAFPSYVENVCICCNIVTFSVTREARGREGGRAGGRREAPFVLFQRGRQCKD